MPQKPDYGIDAPGVVRNLLVIGVVLILSGILFPVIHIGQVTILWSASAFWPGGSFLLSGFLMLAYAKWGKFRHRDRMLNMISWRGDEQVLDVGTGRGLLLIGAARRLTTGKSIGIDVWSTKDLSGNALERTQANVEVEGVKGKVELRSDDARKLSFADDAFDVVLSNLCIHNIPDKQGRAQACREIARVLKPGGTALISDFVLTGFYKKAFEQEGLKTSRTAFNFLTYPPLRVVRAEKKAGQQASAVKD
ncbi:MAG TPA: class I SAM-dependent methyltransferase [Candidatus Angelobacter sp.]|nr:class I SAM-dependent methyltransferase [Candidatus Angelobacter sp.]